MSNSQSPRNLWLAVTAAGLLTLAGCSSQPTDQATNQAPAAPAKKAPAKPAPAKTQAQAAPAKKADTGKSAASAKATPAPKLVTVPKGTVLSAKVGQDLASSKNHVGDTFAATLASSVKVDGKTIIPKGAKVTGHVVTARKKSPVLTVALTSVEVQGKSYPVQTNSVGPAADKAQAKAVSDNPDAAKAKDVIVAAKTRLSFKLLKPVKLPIKG